MLRTCLLIVLTWTSWPGIAWCLEGDSAVQRPVPSHEAVGEARRLVRDAFEADVLNAASNPEPLIEKLVTASGQTEDPARSYALLLEAEQAAVAAGEADRAMELVAIRSREFTIDPVQARVALLEELFTAQARRDQGALVSLFGHAVDTARLGIERESLDHAASAAELAGSVAKSIYLLGKAKNADALAGDGERKQRQAKELKGQISDRRKFAAEFVRAEATLKDSPADPDANKTVGTYLCFYRNDWGDGLNCLAKCGDKTLAALAVREQTVALAAQPNAKELFDLAGAWWSLAQVNEDNLGPQILAHSAEIYEKSREGLRDPVDRALAASRAAAGLDKSPREPGGGVALLGETGYARLVQPIDVDVGDYDFSCLVPAEVMFNENDHVPTLMGHDTSGKWPSITRSDVRYEPHSTGWAKYSCSFHADTSGRYQFAIAIWGRERVQFGRLSLKARGSSKELLRNGAFEDGTEGWSTNGGKLVWLPTMEIGSN